MLLNPSWLNNPIPPVDLPTVQQALEDLAPYFKGIQNSFGKGFTGFYFFAMILAVVLVSVWAINTLIKRKTVPAPVSKKTRSDSTALFNRMLDQLDLTTSDRNLLQQMARDTRLRHPSVFLLSPDMLNWSRKVWIQEKGAAQIPAKQLAQIDRIRKKLFNEPLHRPSSQTTTSQTISHANTAGQIT